SHVQKSFFSQFGPTDHPGPMTIYERGEMIPESEMFDLGDPANLGGKVLSGDPKISARIDYAGGGMLDGVFQATRGQVLITYPFSEHATVRHGEVTLTDEGGASYKIKPGDAYLVKQGSNITWDVKGSRVQKSFCNLVEP